MKPVLGHLLKHVPKSVYRHGPDRHMFGHMCWHVPSYILKQVPEYVLKDVPKHVHSNMPHKYVLEHVSRHMFK